MASTWITLSARWDLSSVQASLNVIISALGTIGLWAFTRYWWRRGSLKVIGGQAGVPLSALLTIAGPGDGWDVMTVLERKIFAKENWHVLVQLIVVVGITLACALAGPIAKVSLRNGLTIARRELQVLEAVKGGGYFGNLLYANVLWNDTAQSLRDAQFPDNQLLDYLPPTVTPPWTYVAEEWNPTWNVACNYTQQTVIPNVIGSGIGNMFDPLSAFPAFRETYDPTWLNASEYRVVADFNAWFNWTNTNQFSDALFFVLVQSNPEVGDRMLHNNDTLRLSLSVLQARDFRVLFDDQNAVAGDGTWRPIGPIGSASYARAECEISRSTQVADQNRMPWPWTNDTASIVEGYRTYYFVPFASLASKHLPVVAPSAHDLFRFYQVYMASINTFQSSLSSRLMSVQVRTVQLSVFFLVALVVLTVLTAYSSLRYYVFLRCHHDKIKDLYVPDSKIEWMIHAVKSSELGLDLEQNEEGKKCNEREHLCNAIFGRINSQAARLDQGLEISKLARVISTRSSVSSPRPGDKPSVSRSIPRCVVSLAEDIRAEQQHGLSRVPSHTSSARTFVSEDLGSICPSPVTKPNRVACRTDPDHRFLSLGGRRSFEFNERRSNRSSTIACPSNESVCRDVLESEKTPARRDKLADTEESGNIPLVAPDAP